jgi:hypothetical protein
MLCTVYMGKTQVPDVIHDLSAIIGSLPSPYPTSILHTAWLDALQNIIFMKNPDFCIPS